MRVSCSLHRSSWITGIARPLRDGGLSATPAPTKHWGGHATTRACATSGDKAPPVLVADGSRFTWQREDLAVVLVEPKIPQNSGNVSRSCAATKVPLHLVAPAFELNDKKLKRAGLDYWDWVCLKPHASVEHFLEFYANLEGEKRLIAFSKFGKTHHAADGMYRHKTTGGQPIRNFLVFGAEDTGLPDVIHDAATHIVRIPMNNFEHVRSINLATSVGVGVWEALRQLDGPIFDEEEVV
jgi:tRNA (cytidine/uridine-2'-O-)-methyltransferase